MAKDCVCFVNSYGGKINIGIENEKNEPLANQIINPKLIEEIQNRISSLTINVGEDVIRVKCNEIKVNKSLEEHYVI